MLGAAVVPERDCILAPAEAALKQGIFRVAVEIGEHRIAFVTRDADDVAGEAAIDVERLLPGYRMRAYDRMLGARIGGPVGNARIGIKPAIGRLAVMQRRESVEISFHPLRQ